MLPSVFDFLSHGRHSNCNNSIHLLVTPNSQVYWRAVDSRMPCIECSNIDCMYRVFRVVRYRLYRRRSPWTQNHMNIISMFETSLTCLKFKMLIFSSSIVLGVFLASRNWNRISRLAAAVAHDPLSVHWYIYRQNWHESMFSCISRSLLLRFRTALIQIEIWKKNNALGPSKPTMDSLGFRLGGCCYGSWTLLKCSFN